MGSIKSRCITDEQPPRTGVLEISVCVIRGTVVISQSNRIAKPPSKLVRRSHACAQSFPPALIRTPGSARAFARARRMSSPASRGMIQHQPDSSRTTVMCPLAGGSFRSTPRKCANVANFFGKPRSVFGRFSCLPSSASRPLASRSHLACAWNESPYRGRTKPQHAIGVDRDRLDTRLFPDFTAGKPPA